MGEYRFSEAADLLRISRWTLARFIAAGDLDVAGTNGKRITDASLRAFLTRAIEPPRSNREPIAMPLEAPLTVKEIARKYRLPLQKFERDVRAGLFEHLRYGRTRTFTVEQEAALVKKIQARDTAPAEPTDPVEADKAKARAALARRRRAPRRT